MKNKLKLLETIRYENGEFENLNFHQKRMDVSRKKLFGYTDKISLVHDIQAWTLETGVSNFGLFKCRIVYSDQIEKIDFIPYTIPHIQSLKIVVDDQIEYDHKFLNRNQLEQLHIQKGECDDILIVKNGLITDTSFSNILFYNGKDWITPAKPLLKGTQRAKLLEQEKIKTADIRVEDLKKFKVARLINAMIGFEDKLETCIDNINE